MNELTDYQKELMRAAAEITKGIVANPNVLISMEDKNLLFQLDDTVTDIATIYENVFHGIKHTR